MWQSPQHNHTCDSPPTTTLDNDMTQGKPRTREADNEGRWWMTTQNMDDVSRTWMTCSGRHGGRRGRWMMTMEVDNDGGWWWLRTMAMDNDDGGRRRGKFITGAQDVSSPVFLFFYMYVLHYWLSNLSFTVVIWLKQVFYAHPHTSKHKQVATNEQLANMDDNDMTTTDEDDDSDRCGRRQGWQTIEVDDNRGGHEGRGGPGWRGGLMTKFTPQGLKTVEPLAFVCLFFSFSFIFYFTNYHLQVIYTMTKHRKRTTTIDDDADNLDDDNQCGWWTEDDEGVGGTRWMTRARDVSSHVSSP